MEIEKKFNEDIFKIFEQAKKICSEAKDKKKRKTDARLQEIVDSLLAKLNQPYD